MSPAFRCGVSIALLSLGALGLGSAPATAQSVGVGPRLAFARSTVDAESSTRYSGGLLRARLSPRTALEVSLDYRTFVNESLGERVRDMPIQGSLLLYLMRANLSPYLLGGIGWYSQRVEEPTTPEEATTTRRVGYHAGLGGEIRVGRHAAVHVDYRYTFIHVGDQEDVETSPGAVPLPGLRGLQEKLKLSHEGSMWTTGVTFYF